MVGSRSMCCCVRWSEGSRYVERAREGEKTEERERNGKAMERGKRVTDTNKGFRDNGKGIR